MTPHDEAGRRSWARLVPWSLDEVFLDAVPTANPRGPVGASPVIRALLIAAGCVAASWAVMIALAARLPPGLAKDLAGFLPACVTTIRVLRKDPRVPRSAKVAIAFAGAWVISPIDLIPEFLPVIGPLDDVVVVALAFRFAARRIPADVLFEVWPADPKLLRRLLGARRSSAAAE